MEKKLAKNDFITAYMHYVLVHNEQPKSVYAFSKINNIDESQFYSFFENFDALEQQIFDAFFNNTIKVLNESPDYLTFDARNKLLSFYFTLLGVKYSKKTELRKMNGNLGSKHFIYINRTFFDLYNLVLEKG